MQHKENLYSINGEIDIDKDIDISDWNLEGLEFGRTQSNLIPTALEFGRTQSKELFSHTRSTVKVLIDGMNLANGCSLLDIFWVILEAEPCATSLQFILGVR